MAESKLVNSAIMFMATILLLFVLRTFSAFMRPFVLAVIITILFLPLLRWSKSKKIPTMVTLTVFITGLFGILYLLVLLMSMGNLDLETKIPLYQNQIAGMTQNIGARLNLDTTDLDLSTIVEPKILSQWAAVILSSVTNVVSEFVVIILFIIFLLPSYNEFMKALRKRIDKKQIQKIKHAIDEVEKSIQGYLYIKLLISLGTALVTGIVLALFGVDFAIILAILVFLLNFIPNIGSIIASGLLIFMFALKFGFVTPLIWFSLIIVLVQFFFGNVLEPKYTGSRLEFSPIVILFSLFLWYWVWGIGGMFIAVPLMSILKIVLQHIETTKDFSAYLG